MSKIFPRVKAIAIAKPHATQIIVTITISSTKWDQMGFRKEKNHLNAKSVVHQKSNVVLARVLRSKPVLFGQMLVVSAVRKLFSGLPFIGSELLYFINVTFKIGSGRPLFMICYH